MLVLEIFILGHPREGVVKEYLSCLWSLYSVLNADILVQLGEAVYGQKGALLCEQEGRTLRTMLKRKYLAQFESFAICAKKRRWKCLQFVASHEMKSRSHD